jgi:hypothetical protein
MDGPSVAASSSRDRLTPKEQTELLVRARAARELVKAGLLDGWIALSLVIDPPASLTGCSPRRPRRGEAD